MYDSSNSEMRWYVLEVYGMTGNFSGVVLEWMDRQKLLVNYNVQFLLLQVQPNDSD